MSLINKQTLSEQIYQILRQDILTQKIKCGEKLTLKVLKERFNVSQTPIREALTRLVDDHLVVYYSNVGVTVVTFTPEEVKEIFEFSGDLDCIAIRYCLQKDNPDFFLELQAICRDADQCLTEGDIAEWKQYSDQFHLVFFKFAGNRWLERAANKMRAQLTLLSNLYQYSGNVEKIHQDHLHICSLLASDKIQEAIDAMRLHYQKDLAFALEALTPEFAPDQISPS
ncbi:MAG: GntR family transcriptional regulator [Eubacteriales bacterium]|nr:GntR family transcriptional regulator [Eubacteriales bacterium]